MKTVLLWFTTKRNLIRMNKELCKRLKHVREFDLGFRERALDAEHIIGHKMPQVLKTMQVEYDEKHRTMIRFQ